MKMKGRILRIGEAHPHGDGAPSWLLYRWAMEEGDFPAYDMARSELCGWTCAELALIADIARLAGTDEALRLAETYRGVPVPVMALTP